jgi:hypothetical protein
VNDKGFDIFLQKIFKNKYCSIINEVFHLDKADEASVSRSNPNKPIFCFESAMGLDKHFWSLGMCQ